MSNLDTASSPVTLITGGDVVTMDPGRRVLVGGAVAVAGDVIVDVGSTSELPRRPS